MLALLAAQGAEIRGSSKDAGAWAPLAVNALAALGYAGIALLVLLQRTVDLRGRLLLGFAAAMALEMALPLEAPWARAVYYLLTGAQLGLELHLVSLLPERPAWLLRRGWVVRWFYAAGLAIGAAGCAAELAGAAVAAAARDALLGAVFPAWAVAVPVLLGTRALRHPEPRGRHQAALVLAGTLPWLILTLVAAGIERLQGAPPDWLWAAEPLVLLGYPVAIFAAVFRYRLFDIELVVRRSLIYGALSGVLILVFYAALGAGGALFSRLVEEDSVWTFSASTLLLGLVFAPLRRALHREIDRRFFPERQAVRRRLAALARELPALGKLPRMGGRLVDGVAEIFRVPSAALLIADPDAGLLRLLAATGDEQGTLLPLADPGIDLLAKAQRPVPAAQIAASLARRLPGLEADGLVVPLQRSENPEPEGLAGLLVLGGRRRPYSAEELDLLILLAHHVALVFENARLFESATYEGLTGLLRREAILEQLDRELERAVRHGRPITVALADLDRFKSVNDRYGHLAGDALLRRTAAVLSEALRGTDAVGRYGGEEFLLVLPETDLEGARRVAEKIRARVEGEALELEDGTVIRATVSIGLASIEEGEATARGLIAEADRRLYEAKSGGRNRVHPPLNDV